MSLEELEKIIDSGDTEGCVALFALTSEADRKAVASYAIERLTRESKNSFSMTPDGQFLSNPRLWVAALAAIAACSLSQLKKAGRHAMLGTAPEVYTILAARRPAWIDEWAELLLEANPFNWPLVRQLVRERICRPPQTNNYVLGLIYGVLDHNPFRQDARKTSLAEALLEDASLLEEDVWQLFVVDGQGEHSLAAHDKYHRAENCWNHAFCKLSQDGRLSRTRLLDATLGALVRDFGSFRSAWFSKFHDMLQPSVAERVERSDHYLNLLASSIPGTVSWALKAVDQIDKSNPLPGARLADSVASVLTAGAKGTVTAALKLLERVAKREPELRPRIALAASEALANQASEVQELAITLIERYGDPSVPAFAETVFRYRDMLAPSVRPRLDQWQPLHAPSVLPKTFEEGPAVVSTKHSQRIAKLDTRSAALAGVPQPLDGLQARRALEIPAVVFDGTEIPRSWDQANAIHPIASLDELIELSASVIEGSGGIDDIERVLDGISRLCGERPADFANRTDWLTKRVQKLFNQHILTFAGDSLENDFRATLLAWLTGRLDPPGIDSRQPGSSHCDYVIGTEKIRFWHRPGGGILALFYAGLTRLRFEPLPGSLDRCSVRQPTLAVGSTRGYWSNVWSTSTESVRIRRCSTRSWRCCGWHRMVGPRRWIARNR